MLNVVNKSVQDLGKGKGNAVPLEARRGPEGSRKLRFSDFVTTAQDGGKVVSLTHRPPLPPQIQYEGKKKVKFTLVQALRLCTGRTTHRESRGIALLFLDHGTEWGEGSASRSARFLPPRKSRYPLYRRLDGP